MTPRKGMSIALMSLGLGLALALLTAGSVFAQKTYKDYVRKYNWRYTDAHIRVREVSLKLSPEEPHLGEKVTVTVSVTSPEDVSNMMVGFASPVGIELLSGKKKDIYWADFKENQTREFSAEVKFVSSPAVLLIRVLGRVRTSDGVRIPVEGGTGFRLVIINEETGEFGFGTIEECFQSPWWNFDPLSGEKYRVSPRIAERDSKWVKDMREVEPSITDWEALYLCRDAMLYSPQSPEETLRVHQRQGWERIQEQGRILLDKGWLEEFHKSPKTDVRTNVLNRPDLLRKLEDHLQWLRRLRKDAAR